MKLTMYPRRRSETLTLSQLQTLSPARLEQEREKTYKRWGIVPIFRDKSCSSQFCLKIIRLWQIKDTKNFTA